MANGRSSGKSHLMMSRSSSREMLLNMLMRSANTATLVGALGGMASSGCWMYFSMESCIDLMMKFMPPSIPTA